MLCILYVTAAGTLLGIVGLLIERVLPATAARRWIWCAAIPTSVILPGLYRTHHPWSITGATAQQAAGLPIGPALRTASLTALDTGLWARVETWNPTINKLWLFASGVLIIWGLANAMRVSDVVSESRRRRRHSAGPEIIDGIPVLVTDQIGPATVGLWRSSVLIPRWVLALPRTQRQYVVRHEEEHRRAHDARLLFVASLPIILMPWNLALWWQLRRLCLAVEMDCDNRVVSALGDANAYGQLLFKVAEASSHGPRLQPAFIGGVGTLERRLTALLAPTPLRHIQRFLLPAAAIALLFVVLSMPHPVLEHGKHTHVTTMTVAKMTPPNAPTAGAINQQR